MNTNEKITPKGDVEIVISYRDGKEETRFFSNAVLRTGRQALAKCLANQIGTGFEFYVNRMVFGDGGTLDGSPRYVNTERNSLYGTTRATKSVISTIDPNLPSQVVMTSVLGYDEAVETTLNEMALRMANGDLYSMATFPDLGKTDNMQITFNWRVSFI